MAAGEAEPGVSGGEAAPAAAAGAGPPGAGAGAAGKPKPEADLVSRLQSEVTELSSLMFNFTGFLQASAPPVSVGGEPVPDLPAGAPRPDAKDLSRQILRKHREVGDLIGRLPPAPPGEAEQLDTLVRLQEENQEVGERLDAELRAAQERLSQLQDFYAALADRQLQDGPFLPPEEGAPAS